MEPLAWGFSFAPWIWAWLTGMTIAGLVLGIGHYTRYKPGLIWTFTTTTLLLALIVFELKIGFDELDYQLYVVRNDPEEVPEFRDHSIRGALDETITDPTEKEYRSGFFYPTEPIPLRAKMKEEIQSYLSSRDERWPSWFIVSDELQYMDKKEWLREQYDRFISPPRARWMPPALHQRIVERRSRSPRMPIALYYKALLSEHSPDLQQIWQEEVLHFHSDYPHDRSLRIWFRLYSGFPQSPESAEARWRLAKRLAGQKELQKARILLKEAEAMTQEQLAVQEKMQAAPSDSLFSAFRPPVDTVMTPLKLRELQGRVYELQTLIAEENLVGSDGSLERLVRFVMLNPHSLDYEQQLDALLTQTDEKDGLRDNLLVAKVKRIADNQRRAERLRELSREFQNTDGGMQALYELTLLHIRLYQEEPKKENLIQARDMLTSFVSLYPNTFYAGQVRKNLDGLPKPD